MRADLFNFIDKKIPMLLTHIDKDPDSPSYGCCDRNYWHYKIRDFSSFVLQQAAFTIGYLYHFDYPENRYYHNLQIKKWSVAGVFYWVRHLYPDGSADEYYPFEKGIPPVAFSLYRMVELYTLFEKDIISDKKIILDAMNRAAKFLIKNPERLASNQELFAITAILKVGILLDNHSYRDKAKERLDRLIQCNYSKEGWFAEYGGPDLGYLSLSLEALVDYNEYYHDERITHIINQIVGFSGNGIFQGGIVGGQFNSRNTEYYLPYGLANLSATMPMANELLMRILNNIDSPLYQQGSIDDRYYLHYVLPSFVKTLGHIQEGNDRCCIDDAMRFFPESGWFLLRDKPIELLIAGKKGGVLSLINNGKHFVEDFGYRIYDDKGRIAVTNWDNLSVGKLINEKCFQIDGKAVYIKYNISSPFKHFVLRVLSFLFGRKIVSSLKKRMIFFSKNIDLQISRRIKFRKKYLIIFDCILSKKAIAKLKGAPKYSARHVASSKSFIVDELMESRRVEARHFKKVFIRKIYNLQSGDMKVSIRSRG